MSENRYEARKRQRQERLRQWHFDQEMRQNDQIDRPKQRANGEHPQHDGNRQRKEAFAAANP